MLNKNLKTWISGAAVAVLIMTGCGQVANSASSSSKHVAATSDNFKAEVLEADQLVMVDFWAAWCGPCRMIAPTLDELVTELDGKLKLVKVDVDRNAELSQEYKVQGIPYLVLFKDGKVVDAMVGAANKKTYQEWVTKHL